MEANKYGYHAEKKKNLELLKLSNGLKRAAEKKQTELEKKNLLDLSLKNSLNHPKMS